MKTLKLDIAKVHLDPANVRRHPERNLAAIKASLARFGQVTPIVVDADDVVRKGNGTVMAARELGWTHIEAIRTGLTGSELTGYAIADNRSSDLAVYDDGALAETLRSLQSEGFDIADVGFTGDELDTLIEGMGTGLLAAALEVPGGECSRTLHSTSESTRPLCPACGRDSSGRRPT